MSITRTACRTRIRTLINEPTAKFFTEAEINSWIDDACRDISTKTFSNQLVCTTMNTVNGTSTYAFPTTCNTSAIVTLGIKTILNSANVSLQYVTPDLIGRVHGENNALMWSEWNDTIILTPTPTAAYTIQPLIRIEVGCVAAGNLGLKSIYHHLVPSYGHYKALQKRRDFEAAIKVFQQYEMEMQRIGDAISKRYDINLAKITVKDQAPVD